MNTVDLLPPFRYNPWKHHLHWVKGCLYQILSHPDDLKGRDEIFENINSINSNYIDVYTGTLTPAQLIHSLKEELNKLGINDKGKFSTWISRYGFKPVTLSDASVWILREGVDDAFYIHIHPARNAFQMTRIHGNSWKTAIIATLYHPLLKETDLSVINEVRAKYLKLSPVKNTHTCQRLLKAIKLISIF